MGNMLSRAAWLRIIPFVLFMVLLALRGHAPASMASVLDSRWIYGVSVLVVGGTLALLWRHYSELGQGSRPSWWQLLVAVLVGLLVFGLWINLTEPWMLLGQPTATFRPVDAEGQLQWGLIVVRWIGAALLVPVMEELFWRSFLMRWIDNPDFELVDPGQVSLKAMGLSTLVFMLAHTQWLGAIVAGLAYAFLYRWTRSLWVSVLAHAVTNGVLGLWVLVTGTWQFW
jgi:CAAX prenyl protease-like protein